MTTPTRDRDVEGFLALLAARRSPRTVEAYRRDLTALAAHLGKPVGDATIEELELYTAQLRAAGLASATIARRTAAARSFFRHQQMLGDAGRQSGRSRLAAAPGAAAAAHAFARRGRAADRRGRRDAAARAARPGARRAPLRRRAARLRGDGAPESRCRPRRPPDPSDRQGRQGTGRPDRAPCRRGAGALRRAGTAASGHAPPARALPERPRRTAHPGRGVPHPAQARGEGRARPTARPPPPPAAFLRDASARGRRRPPLRSRNARTCRSFHHRDLHPRNRSPTS